MAVIINPNVLNALTNIANNSSNPQAAQTAQLAATILSELPDALFNSLASAIVSTTSATANAGTAQNPNLAALLQSGQVLIDVPDIQTQLPNSQVILSTNQVPLNTGDNLKIQIPDASSFTKLTPNNVIANVNVAVVNPQGEQTQTFNARLNIINALEGASFQTNHFIKQDLSNPENLVGKNFSAYFIQTPNEEVTSQLPKSIALQLANSNDISALNIKINNIILPSDAGHVPTASSQAAALGTTPDKITFPSGNFPATVIFTGDNETILSTPLGSLRLNVNLQLPINTEIDFDIAGIDLKNLKLPDVILNNNDALKAFLNSDDSAIKNLLQALQSSAQPGTNANAQQLVQNQLPNVTDKFIMAKALWFLGNVSNGSSDKWLSDDIKNSLGKNSQNIINKLDGLFSNLKSFFSPSEQQQANVQQGWNNYIVPFMDSDNKLNHVNFFTERDANKDNQSSGKNMRFVVELNTPYFGEVQIDGFLNQNVESKKLDVIFRHSAEIDEGTKDEIRQIFIEAAETSGIKGEILFMHTDINEIPRPYSNSTIEQKGYAPSNSFVI